MSFHKASHGFNHLRLLIQEGNGSGASRGTIEGLELLSVNYSTSFSFGSLYKIEHQAGESMGEGRTACFLMFSAHFHSSAI